MVRSAMKTVWTRFTFMRGVDAMSRATAFLRRGKEIVNQRTFGRTEYEMAAWVALRDASSWP